MSLFMAPDTALARRVTLAGQPPGRLAEIYFLADDAHLAVLADRVAMLDACFPAGGAFAADVLLELVRHTGGLALVGSYEGQASLPAGERGRLLEALRAAAGQAGSGRMPAGAWAQLAAGLEHAEAGAAALHAMLVTAQPGGTPPLYELLLLVAEPAAAAPENRDWRLRAFALAAALDSAEGAP